MSLQDNLRNAALAANEAADEIDRLNSLLYGVSQDAIDGGWTAKGLMAYAKRTETELAAVKAERDAMKVYAERYRWLRMQAMDMFDNASGKDMPYGGGLRSELDNYVDAAISKGKP